MDINTKMIDYICTIIKNSKEFKQFNFYTNFFLLTTIILNITNITIYYLNITEINKLLKINHSIYIDIIDKKSYNINNKINILLENQQYYLRLITNKHKHKDEDEEKYEENNEENSSILSFNVESTPDSVIDDANSVIDDADDKLINECYDIVPVTNIKQTSLFRWIFT